MLLPFKVMGWMFFIRLVSFEQSSSSVTWVSASEPMDYDNPRTALTYDEVYGPPGENEETIDQALARIVNKRLKKEEDHSAQSETATLPGKQHY